MECTSMHAKSDGQDHAEQKNGFTQFGDNKSGVRKNYLKRKFIYRREYA